MGFDIAIQMVLEMCPVTGKPYYLGKDLEKIYDISSIIVPEHLKGYLVGRGNVFHAYTEDFNNVNKYNVSVFEFLETFPTWKSVLNSDYEDERYWNENDHNSFKELLIWCENQRAEFRVDWSY